MASTFVNTHSDDILPRGEQPPFIPNVEHDGCSPGSMSTDMNDSAMKSEACIEKLCSVLDNCNDKASRHLFKSILDIILDDDFDYKYFRGCIKGFTCCLKYNEKRFSNQISSEGFIREDVQFDDGTEIHSSVLYKKDILAVLRKQIALAKDGDFEYRCQHSHRGNNDNEAPHNYIYSHPMHTSHFMNLQDDLERRVKTSPDKSVYWSNRKESLSFPGFIQIFTDKTVTTMKANGMAAHAVHAVFLNASKTFRRSLIQNGHTIVGFLPTYILDVSPSSFLNTVDDVPQNIILRETDQDELISADLISANNNAHGKQDTDSTSEIVELLDNLTLTSTAKGRQVKIGLLYSAMKRILKGASDSSVNGFPIELLDGESKICFPMLISYCCDIPEAKDMSAVKHNLSTPFPCHICLVTLDDIRSLLTAQKRCFTETHALRSKIVSDLRESPHSSKLSTMEQCRDTLNEQSLAPWPSFLEDLKVSSQSFIPSDIYELFTFEPLHNLHLGISKLLKQCTYYYVTSKHRVSFQHFKRNARVTIGSKKAAILRGCNTYLRAIDEDSGMSSLRVDFSSKNASITLNGLFMENGIRGMLEGKDYKTVDYVFPFIAAFIDRITQEQDGKLSSIHILYSELLQHLFVEIDRYGLTEKKLSVLRNKVSTLKEKASSFFSKYVERGLYTLKFHLLDHLVDDIEKYSSLAYLDAGPYEHYNAVIKQFYRKTSKRLNTALDETVRRMDQYDSTTFMINQGDKSVIKDSPFEENVSQSLVRNGNCVTLAELRGAMINNFSSKTGQILDNLRVHMSARDVPVLFRLVEELLLSESISVHDSSVELNFVNSGFIDGYPVPTLDDYNEDLEVVEFKETNRAYQQRQRIFASHCFGPSRKKTHSNIFLKGSDDISQFWFAKVLSLFHVSVPLQGFSKQMALVKYYQVTKPMDAIDRALKCVCLRWETEDDIDHTLEPVPNSDTIEVGERFGLVSFQSICGVAHVVRANYAIQPFSKEIPWPYHRFYVNRFLH